MKALRVTKPGPLSLLQDAGRFGFHRIGLTTGGPLDGPAMTIANRLVGNPPGATAIECSLGGLALEAQAECLVAVTGGDAPLHINDREQPCWRSHRLRPGDTVQLGFARRFCRSYLAVAGSFAVAPTFGSCASVVREGIGGLDGGKLAAGDNLPIGPGGAASCLRLNARQRPVYGTDITLRLVPGYQWEDFDDTQRRRFLAGSYEVTDRADRMGYRLSGPGIDYPGPGLLSEGICMGAVQVPADGQPIVLLQDRQTIGGYPKLGAALSLDTARLAQLTPGARVRFAAITEAMARDALRQAAAGLEGLQLEPCDG